MFTVFDDDSAPARSVAATTNDRLFFFGMDKPVDRLRQLECFRRVIEHGSISAAARVLGVGQPAVSKQLRALEERLGVRLLERSTRGLEATPAGSGLYAGLPRLFEELDMLEDDVAASARGLGRRRGARERQPRGGAAFAEVRAGGLEPPRG
jgi:molybdenum-dependent DNA-binding transcriptional regulator ModE